MKLPFAFSRPNATRRSAGTVCISNVRPAITVTCRCVSAPGAGSAQRTELPDRIDERVQQMIDFLVAIRRPDGVLPALGDDDGGCLLPLQRRSPCDARGLFGVAATLPPA